MRQQGRLPFEYEVDDEADNVTSFGGLPLVAEVMAKFGLDESIRRHVRLGRARRKFEADDIARAAILTVIAGGDCLDDIARLRDDAALCRLLARDIPSPETVRQALYEFHSDALIEEGIRLAADAGEIAYVPGESVPLKGLGQALRELNASVQRRWPQQEATVDIDATLQESTKKEAKRHYAGGRGYQPMLAYWTEQQVVIFDEFRDGNVAAAMDTDELVERVFAALPEGISVRRCRADSALYAEKTIRWLNDQAIEFAIGVRTHPPFVRACETLPESAWTFCEQHARAELHVAELDYRPPWARRLAGLRYIAVRKTPRQQEFFEESQGPVYLGVVTNRRGNASDVVHWYWDKAGTIEHAHDVVKNELGGGVLPCGRFGANAAWLRLCVLAFNVLRIVRELGPTDLRDARPKRLRFNLFSLPATVASHARSLVARLGQKLERARQVVTIREMIWAT